MILLTVRTVDFDWLETSCLAKSLIKYKHLLGNNEKKDVTVSNFRALFLNFKHFL